MAICEIDMEYAEWDASPPLRIEGLSVNQKPNRKCSVCGIPIGRNRLYEYYRLTAQDYTTGKLFNTCASACMFCANAFSEDGRTLSWDILAPPGSLDERMSDRIEDLDPEDFWRDVHEFRTKHPDFKTEFTKRFPLTCASMEGGCPSTRS